MKKFSKVVLTLATATAIVLSACSAHSSRSYTFNFDVDEAVKVEMDTLGKYTIRPSEEHLFSVYYGDELIIEGMAVYHEMFDEYVEDIPVAENCTVITNTDSMFAWEYSDVDEYTEYNRLVKVDGVDGACILMSGYVDIDDERGIDADIINEAYERMMFTEGDISF